MTMLIMNRKKDVFSFFFDFLKWLVWDFSGLRFFWEKARPPQKNVMERSDYRRPSTLFPILLLCYILLYLGASYRYENKVENIKSSAAVLTLQLGTDKFKHAFSRICDVQHMHCPVKPYFNDPMSIYISLTKEDKHKETIHRLKELVELWKFKLDGVRLNEANLDGIDFSNANLLKADLTGASIRESNFSEATLVRAVLNTADMTRALLYKTNLHGADMFNTNLGHAEINQADFSKADMRDVQLDNAVILESNFMGAKNLTSEQLCRAEKIYKTDMDKSLKFEVRMNCPKNIDSFLAPEY